MFSAIGFNCENFSQEAESQDYGACLFNFCGMKNTTIKFRTGKITPIKRGQFVTLWKRIDNGDILPHDIADPLDFFVVGVRKDNILGQFVFPKRILLEKGIRHNVIALPWSRKRDYIMSIISKDGKGGKRAIRLYPPWDKTENPQAIKTQRWQLKYFFEIPLDSNLGAIKLKKLFQEE